MTHLLSQCLALHTLLPRFKTRRTKQHGTTLRFSTLSLVDILHSYSTLLPQSIPSLSLFSISISHSLSILQTLPPRIMLVQASLPSLPLLPILSYLDSLLSFDLSILLSTLLLYLFTPPVSSRKNSSTFSALSNSVLSIHTSSCSEKGTLIRRSRMYTYAC